MTVEELKVVLEQLIKQGKGNYIIVDELGTVLHDYEESSFSRIILKQ